MLIILILYFQEKYINNLNEINKLSKCLEVTKLIFNITKSNYTFLII